MTHTRPSHPAPRRTRGEMETPTPLPNSRKDHTMTITAKTAAAAANYFTAAAGDGYSIDSTDDLAAVLVQDARTDRDVAIYQRPNGGLVLVGDMHGLWAVDCNPADIELN